MSCDHCGIYIDTRIYAHLKAEYNDSHYTFCCSACLDKFFANRGVNGHEKRSKGNL